MTKRHLARASSRPRFPLTHAPQRLEEAIQALTNESIEDSLEEIEAAFRKHFAAQQREARSARKKAAAD